MKYQKGYTLPQLVGLIVILIIFGVFFLGGYVLTHFIMKFW